MHGLPHSSGYEHGGDVFRLHVVGQRNGRRTHVAGGADVIRAQKSGAELRRGIRKVRQCAGCGRTRSSSRRPARPSSTSSLNDTQFADFHSHGWIFRAVFKHDRKGNAARRERQAGCVRRSGEIQESRAPEGHPPRERHALHRLPLRAGQPRQRQALRRNAERRRDRLRRLPRNDSAEGDAGHVGDRGASAGHKSGCPANAMAGSVVSTGRTGASISGRCWTKT